MESNKEVNYDSIIQKGKKSISRLFE